MILEDTPLVEGVTTIHFPDVQANYFRLLLDFLYSGETCVPADEVEYLHELLALLQVKQNVWRSGNGTSKKDNGECTDSYETKLLLTLSLFIIRFIKRRVPDRYKQQRRFTW